MACGIYMYENKNTGKRYIGQSTNIRKRKWEHLHNYKKNIRKESKGR